MTRCEKCGVFVNSSDSLLESVFPEMKVVGFNISDFLSHKNANLCHYCRDKVLFNPLEDEFKRALAENEKLYLSLEKMKMNHKKVDAIDEKEYHENLESLKQEIKVCFKVKERLLEEAKNMDVALTDLAIVELESENSFKKLNDEELSLEEDQKEFNLFKSKKI